VLEAHGGRIPDRFEDILVGCHFRLFLLAVAGTAIAGVAK